MVATPESIPILSVAYHEEDGRYRARYDSRETTPSMAVVGTVASVRGVPPESIRPMYDSIDTDALNGLVTDARVGPVSVTFPFGGYDVTVTSDGFVDLADPDPGRP